MTWTQRHLGAALCALLFLAPSLEAAPNVTFSPYESPEAASLAALATAQQSVDVAHYNIRSQTFLAALRDLKDRGVAIRIVVDAKNAAKPWNTLDDVIEAEGFAIKRYENRRHRYAIMHHKFCVIDGRRVLTGSFNWNNTAELVNDENMISLDDPAIVGAYQTEFAELWGTQAETAGVVQGANSRVLFSPEDRPRNAIIDAIRGAQVRIRVAMFSFKDRDVAKALADAATRGVEVTLVTEKKQADGTREDERVANAGGRVIVGANQGSTHSAMHQKFAVVDDQTVITGACNWTWTAFTNSNEDVLFIDDSALARRYTDAFAALVARYDSANYRASDFGVQKSEAGVHVTVRMPNTGIGDKVVIVGGATELGAWDPTQGVELRTSSGIFPVWSGKVRLPAATSTSWKAVLIRADGSVRWELGQDRALTVDTSGTDTVTSGEFRDEIEVRLAITGPVLPQGHTLSLVGAHEALGAWDPTKGLVLRPDPSTPGRYLAKVDLPGRTLQNCKLVEHTAAGLALWEPGHDRQLDLHDQPAPQDVQLTVRPPAPPPAATTPTATTPAATTPAPAATTPAATTPAPAATTPTATTPAPAATTPAPTTPAPAATTGAPAAPPSPATP
jgi:HKD family nuclease